jgi:large subunit ribosomal protein L9
MKVILMRDVKGVGHAHETLSLSDGYALNYLIPKKWAVVATPAALKDAELRMKQATERSAVTAALIAQNIASLASANIVVKAKANEKGHLYDAVGESEIRNAAKEQARVDIPEDAIKLEKPLKALGTFDVPVSVGDVFGKFSITIEAEA